MSCSDFINKKKYEAMNNNLRKKTAGNMTLVKQINAIRNIQHINEYYEPEINKWFGVNFNENSQYPDAIIDNSIPNCNFSCIPEDRIYRGGIFVDGAYDYVECNTCQCEKNPYCIDVLSDVDPSRIYRGGIFVDGAYDYVECDKCNLTKNPYCIDVLSDVDPSRIYRGGIFVDGAYDYVECNTCQCEKNPYCIDVLSDVDPSRIYRGGIFVDGAYDYVECDKCNLTKNSQCLDVLLNVDPSRIYRGGVFVEGAYDYVECKECGINIDVNEDIIDPDIVCDACNVTEDIIDPDIVCDACNVNEDIIDPDIVCDACNVNVNDAFCDEPFIEEINNPNIPSIPLISTKPISKKTIKKQLCFTDCSKKQYVNKKRSSDEGSYIKSISQKTRG
jgi:hypothetical protein